MDNNERKNGVKQEIYTALIELLYNKPFASISISEITSTAQVSRNSFYRNFSSKEDILESYIKQNISNWKNNYDKLNIDSNAELFGSLFQHLKNNSTFYLMLRKQNLFNLFSKAYLELYGATAEDTNIEAYVKNFIAGGVLGWIEEWLNRGMQESAETMTALLANTGMK